MVYFRAFAYLLLISLIVNYVLNVLHLIFSFATYRKDELFSERYAAKHPISNRVILIAALLTEHISFVLYFCRFFNLAFFKACLQEISTLFFINYFWGGALLANMFAIVAAIIAIVR